MKKRLLTLLLALIMVLPFAGCSCTSRTTLSFSDGWNAGITPSLSTFRKEILHYDINYKTSYADEGFDYTKSNDLDKYAEFDFTDGTYSIELALLDKNNALIKNRESDILGDDYGYGVFYLKSEFNIQASYKIAGQSEFETFDDTVVQEVFFCVSEKSFAPVYSYTYSKSSVLTLDNTKANVEQKEIESETFYTKEKMTVSYIKGVQAGSSKENKYSVGTVIDNTELLFAIRSINGLTKEGSSVNLPVVSPAFGNATDLTVKRYKEQNETVSVEYCGTELSDLQIAIDKIGYRLASSTNFGKTQMVYMQKAAAGELPNRNLVIKYYEPLTSYGSFLSMGVLEFSLTSVSVEV